MKRHRTPRAVENMDFLVAQELRNPLSYALSNLELAQRLLREKTARSRHSSEVLADFVESALEGVIRAANALDQLAPSSTGLPINEAPNSAATRNPPAKLLIVDDEEAILLAVRRLLAGEFDVHLARSGEEALQIITSQDLDLVLCDLMMPGISGIDLFEIARVGSPHLEKKFIFMTGGAALPKIEEFLSRVPNASLRKPFEIEVLEKLLATQLKLLSAPPKT